MVTKIDILVFIRKRGVVTYHDLVDYFNWSEHYAKLRLGCTPMTGQKWLGGSGWVSLYFPD